MQINSFLLNVLKKLKAPVATLFAVSLLTIWVYSRSFHGELQFDDEVYIREGLSLSNILKGLDSAPLRTLFSGNRFLVQISFALNYEFSGLAVEGYHLFNIIVHILVVWCVYFFAAKLIRDILPSQYQMVARAWFPVCVATVFALHPIQTQAVSYVVQRSETLASLFYILTLLALLKFVEKKGYESFFFWVLGMALFLMGWMSKEIIVTAPVALLAYVAFFKEKGTFRRAVFGVMPFLLGGGIIGVWKILQFTPEGGAGFDLEGLGPADYLLTQLCVLLYYLRLVFWPAGQNVDHDFTIYHSLLDGPVLIAVFFWVMILIGVASAYRKRKVHWFIALVGFGILWFLLILAPTSSLIPLADPVFEHRLYLPLVGVALAVLGLVFWILERFVLIGSHVRAIAGVMIGVMLLLAPTAYARNAVWVSRVALWEDSVKKSPRKSRPHNNLGNSYFLVGESRLALRHYKLAAELDQDNAEAFYNIGMVYKSLGVDGLAERYYQVYVEKMQARRALLEK